MITHPDDKLPTLGDEFPEIVGSIQIGGAIGQAQLRLVAGILTRSLYKDEWTEGSDWRVRVGFEIHVDRARRLTRSMTEAA